MHHRHSRIIQINKSNLIEKIKKNKEAHIKEYAEAKEAYIIEANRQLEEAKKKLDSGELKVYINLTMPVNREAEYDNLIEMFNWEVKEEIEITQSEFNDYVLDENDSSKAAKFANSLYSLK